MYIRHTLIAWARFPWSRPQTTSHVVLVRPGGDRKIVRACESCNGAMATRYWSEQEAIDVCKRSRESQNGARAVQASDRARERRRKQRDIASEESKAKAKNLTDYTRTTLRSLSETLQTTALLSSPLYLRYISSPAHSTYTLHVLQRISTCIFPDILLREAYSAHAYS